MFTRTRSLVVACATVLLVGILPANAGNVILTIDGDIAGQAPMDMTLEDIEALGTATVVTKTPWHEEAVTFEGVSLASLLEKAGAKGKTLSVFALNNYRSEMPVSDIGEHGVILAYKQNGEYMPVSDKGPLFIVYPFDADPALNNEVYYARSAWQVRSITVED
jgi:hypothetical protein